MNKLVIFDLDGTILYTLKDLQNALNYALKKNGYKERSLDETKAFIGSGVRKLIERCDVPLDKIEEVFSDFQTFYNVHMADNSYPYDGIIDMMEELFKHNVRMAVYSNKYDEAVKKLCYPFFSKYISIFEGESKTNPRKPDPTVVKSIIERFNVSASDTYYVGDSDIDYKTGINAKTNIILCTWGYRGRDFLASLSHNTIIDNPNEIVDIVCK